MTAITLAVLALCACADVVGLGHGDPGRDTRQGTPTLLMGSSTASSPGATPAVAAVSAVTVTLSDHALQLAATDQRLTAAAVAAAVEQELQQHRLLLATSPAVHTTLAITVQDFTTVLASNASVLGYSFRNAVLIGEVRVQGASVSARPPFTVHARVRLTSRDPGAHAASLGPLYTRFAQVVVADLRGVDAPSETMPR